MFTVVLYQPEIPPNTGNVIRLCANTGCELHLVKPLGFPLDDARMRRAGLDYHEFATLVVHESWAECVAALAGRRIFAATTRGATRPDQAAFQPDDVLLFGPENPGPAHRRAGGHPAGTLPAPADATGQPQHESVQRRGRHRL